MDDMREAMADVFRARDLGADEKDLAKLGLQFRDFGKSLIMRNQSAFEIELYRAAVDLAPQDKDAALLLAWALVDADEVDQRNPEQAIEWAQKTIELSPDDHSARWCLGLAYYRLGKFAEANKSLSEALAAKSDSVGPHFHMAMVKERLGDHDGALTLFNEAEIRRVERHSDDGWVAAWLKKVRDEAADVIGIAQPDTAGNEAKEISKDSAE
jgi:tetratricopeptide (TPR) repeat protein